MVTQPYCCLFSKGENFFYFLFASQNDRTLATRGLLLEESIDFVLRSNSCFFLSVDPKFEGRQK